MAGGNEAKRSDRMELPKDSDDEDERHVFRKVEAVPALRFVPACLLLRLPAMFGVMALRARRPRS
jgi:hypothetical protein